MPDDRYIDVRDTKVYRKIKKAYLEAVENKEESFKVEGCDFLTSFAKYFIEHIENQRKRLGLSIYNPKKKKK